VTADHSGHAATLAACRRAGTLAHLPLHELLSADDAEAVQAQAVAALGWTACGYKIGATNLAVQQALACTEPVSGPLFREAELPSGAEFRLPPGVLGLESEFAFRLARDYPGRDGVLDLASLADAVDECRAAIEVVGRRLEADIPLNHKSVIADFAINVAFALGDPIPAWRDGALLDAHVRALARQARGPRQRPPGARQPAGVAALARPQTRRFWPGAPRRRHRPHRNVHGDHAGRGGTGVRGAVCGRGFGELADRLRSAAPLALDSRITAE
jgi:2-keto-4-pentenoate hydratase